MRFSANRDPGGPADPSAYWRRRFFILGGGLAVLAVLAWQFSGSGPDPSAASAAARSSMAALRMGETLPPEAYGSPAAAPSLTTPAEVPPTSAPPSPSPSATPTRAKPSAKATPSGAAAGRSCAPGDIVLSLLTSQASYGKAAQPQFLVYAVSTAKSPCQLPYGPGSVRVVVTRHGHVVWDSAACRSAVGKPVQFQLGVPQPLTISWNRQAASPSGCAGSLSPGATGTFDAVAMMAGRSSQVRAFKLVS